MDPFLSGRVEADGLKGIEGQDLRADGVSALIFRAVQAESGPLKRVGRIVSMRGDPGAACDIELGGDA